MPISPLRLPAVILFRTSFPPIGQSEKTLYVRVKANGNIPTSAATTFTIPARPATPAVPTVSDYTDVSITVATMSGQEYRLGSGTWQDSGAFSGLTPETQYTVETRVKATTNSFASLTNSINTTTKTAAGDGPQVGGIIVTDTTITLPYDATWEYSTDGTTWNDTREFTGLTPTTQHTYYVRIKETTTAMASNPTEVKVYTAASAPAVGVGFDIDYAAETVVAQTNYEVSTDGSTWSTGSIDITPGGTLYVRVAAVENGAPASAPTENTLAPRPPAPDAETVTGGNRQISGLTDEMEYSTDGATWTRLTADDLQGGVLSNLDAGTYRVRYAAVANTKFASESIAVQVTRPSGSATYPPIVADTENGTVAFTPAAPIWGQRVTITPKPDEGFEVDSVTVTDRNGDPISVTDNQDGTWSFIQPSGRVTITVTFRPTTHVCPSESFTDVDQAAWYHAAVDYMVETGLMRGTSATTFSPAAETSRGMIAAILWRLEGEPAAGESGFADVASQMYYAEAIAWAKENGIVNGVDAIQFQPDRAITREELAAILYRYAEYKGYDTTGRADLSGYSDAGIISPYAVEAMQWAHAEEIIQGVTTTTLAPQGGAIRAQAATMLMRFIENQGQ